MKKIKENWDAMRLVRLMAGSLIIWSAVVDRQPLLGLMGGILLVQAVLNVGCGAAGCRVPARSNQRVKEPSTESMNEITYEEVQ